MAEEERPQSRTLLFLSEQEVRQALTMREAIEASSRAFRLLESGGAVVPERLVIPVDAERGDFSLIKPALLTGDGTLGTKLVAVRQGNAELGLPTVPSLVVLQDATAMPVAVMGGTHLTAARTAGGSGVATALLAPDNAAHLVVFGAGLQAHQHALAVCAARPSVSLVTIVNRSRPRAEGLVAALRAELPAAVRVADPLLASDAPAVRAALATADVVCCTTAGGEPLFPAAWLGRPRCHLNLVGSYRPDRREADRDTIEGAALVVADSEAALKSCGELADLPPGAVVHLLGRLLLDGAPPAAGRTVFKSVGTGVQDTVTAAAVLRRATELGLGTRVPL